MYLENNLNKKYKSTQHLVYSCQYHVIWCPKYRKPVLVGDVATDIYNLILEKQGEYGYEVLSMEIMPDHIHLLLDVSPLKSIHGVVSKIKGVTSHEMRAKYKHLRSRLPTLWSRGKFISSCGSVTLDVVKKYIEEQKTR